jgi:hypothetical protein
MVAFLIYWLPPLVLPLAGRRAWNTIDGAAVLFKVTWRTSFQLVLWRLKEKSRRVEVVKILDKGRAPKGITRAVKKN